MNVVLRTIRILVITTLINLVTCQDGYSDRDILRFQQQMAGEGPIDTITGYNANVLRHPNVQSLPPVSAQYQMTENADKNEDYNRADRGRTRKVYRIKNPFQRQDDENRQDANTSQDADTGASNQYASMQYSLPPEEFLQQMRENQYYQQVSSPAPSLGYTATPQPYQYSTISYSTNAPSGYDNQQNQNQIPQLEPKISNPQSYRSYQYGPNTYGIDTVQSTPAPMSYMSTPLPNNQQFVGTAPNYVSSSSPIYLSSPPNMQQYVSSPNSVVQTGTSDYKVTSTLGSNSLNYDTNEAMKKMQIDHYDNSANGIRYPVNMQQQYQNEYPSSTMSPSSTPYPDPMREWQNPTNNGNSLPKSIQDIQYQKYPYNRNPQDNRYDQNPDNANGDTHRIGNVAAANNLYFNYAQPDYQNFPNFRTRSRDVEYETTTQAEYYSHGEYGWRLNNDKKNLVAQASNYPVQNYPRFQTPSSQNDGVAVSQMSFHMDTGRHTYNPISKSSPDSAEAQEFAKAAAKAHENMKQRQQFYENIYASYNSHNGPSTPSPNNYYEKQANKYFEINNNPYIYGAQQPDLITASPYYLATSKEIDEKPKRPFDHDKALKNIVPIDVSNVVNSENQQKIQSTIDNNNRIAFQNYKEQIEQNMKQNYKAITDAYYQDKNSAYGFNIKNRPEETGDALRFLESNNQFYNKQPNQEQVYTSPSQYTDKRFNDGVPQPAGFAQSQQSNNYQDSIQSSANIQQQQQQPRSQPTNQNPHPTDITSILKLNDIPYRITQNLPPDAFTGRQHSHSFEHIGLPTPLPMRLNQNVASHQIDVANDILNKLILNKQQPINLRPEIDPQTGNLLSTINGIKVANPFNVDLKLVADMLKGKPAIEDSQMIALRDQFAKPQPIKIDFSQLQHLLGTNPTIGQLNDGLASYSSPYLDIYGSRYPYQGVKYSRSQEEEESLIPIADASNTHPIGAVIEQDEPINIQEINNAAEIPEHEEDIGVQTYNEDRPKGPVPERHRGPERHKHPNSLPGRHQHPRKYPKESSQHHLFLKAHAPHSQRVRVPVRLEKSPYVRRRRVKRPRSRVMRAEPLFEAENEENIEPEIPILLRPPPPTAESKSDRTEEVSS